MKDNISPEEKLLRLIKQDKTSTPLNLPKKTAAYSFPQKYLIPLSIQKLIIALFAVSCVYLIISFIYPWVGFKKIKLPDIPPEKVEMEGPESEPKEEPKPYEFYLQGLSQRQIFSNPTAQEGAGPSPLASADLIKDLNLVGIISGVNPQAVIEDKKTQKTYYLRKGQFIGELQIEDIQEGKIIVTYNGQKYELYL